MSDPPSPTVSVESGTATNLNTPCSGESAIGELHSKDQNIVPDAQIADHVTSSPPSSSKQQDQDIQPTWPGKIDRTKIRAQACWHPDQNMSMLLDMHWAGQHSSAVFKLHTGLRLEGAPGTHRNGLINAFIFIYPERIRQLSFTAQPQYIPFGAPTIALTFELDKPPVLVLPKTYAGLGPGAEDAMRSLHSLVQQSNFTIYASLPRKRFPMSWWEQCCKNIAEHKVKTIASLTNMRNIYQGHGGQVIEGNSLLEIVDVRDDAAVSSLPVYQETDPSIPLSRPAKRKRFDEESSTIEQTVLSTDPVATDPVATQTLIRGIIDEKLALYERKREELFSTHTQMIKKMVKEMVEEMLSAHTRKVEALLADKDDDLSFRIKEGIDNEMEVLQESVMESVMEQISSVPIQAHFTFPNHPYL